MSYTTDIDVSVPDPVDLICLNCQVNPVDFEYSPLKTDFHCQAITCRLLMHTMKECIATPSIDNSPTFHVIVSQEFYLTNKLQERLKSLSVQFSGRQLVSWKVYEACLTFAFTFKLAPTWNLVGKAIYLRGSDFLSSDAYVEAVEWNISYKSPKARLRLRPMMVNLAPISLEALGVSEAVLDNFRKSRSFTDTINLTLFHCPWVYVLPKFTRARVVSVSKKLPPSCPFNSYKDLRSHWKNMYSYRLPKYEMGMLFYEIIFPKYPNQHFTYPGACIFAQPPDIQDHDNKFELTLQFTNDLDDRALTSICGKQVNFYPVTKTDDKLDKLREQVLIECNIDTNFHDEQPRYTRESMLKAREKTVFYHLNDNDNNNIEDVCSYYDLPSMYLTEPEHFKENNTDSEQDEDYLLFPTLEYKASLNPKISQLPEPTKSKPVIKNIQNVRYDLKKLKKRRDDWDINKMNTKIQRERMQQDEDELNQNPNDLNEASGCMQPVMINSHKSSEDYNCRATKEISDNLRDRQKQSQGYSNYRLSSLILMDSQASVDNKENSSENENSDDDKWQIKDDASCDFAQSLLSSFTPSVSLTQNNDARTYTGTSYFPISAHSSNFLSSTTSQSRVNNKKIKKNDSKSTSSLKSNKQSIKSFENTRSNKSDIFSNVLLTSTADTSDFELD